MMKACCVKITKVEENLFRVNWENTCCVPFVAYVKDPAEVTAMLAARCFEIRD